MLYKRDYKILTDGEKMKWEIAENNYNTGGIVETANKRAAYVAEMPLAALHYKQLFPNHWLNTRELFNTDEAQITLDQFREVLDKGKNERKILEFIRENNGYFIIASILRRNFRFGHHDTFLFKEFPMAPSYQADYLLVGKNSAGYHFVFVELENSNGQITTADGEFSTTILAGLRQVDDWKVWLQSNFNQLRTYFHQHLGIGQFLPREFYELDLSRIAYVVVAGRRSDFAVKTYQRQRKLLEDSNVLVLHYDNLLDSSAIVIKERNF